MAKSNFIFKFVLSLLCAISFSSISLTSLNAFAEDDQMLETDFDMQEPNIVEEPSSSAQSPVAVPAPSEPALVPPPPAMAPREHKKKHEAAVHKAAKKHPKVVKAAKKEKKAVKAKIEKKNKKNKKKTKKS